MSHEEESRMDREVLAATFQARVKLARQERGAAA